MRPECMAEEIRRRGVGWGRGFDRGKGAHAHVLRVIYTQALLFARRCGDADTTRGLGDKIKV